MILPIYVSSWSCYFTNKLCSDVNSEFWRVTISDTAKYNVTVIFCFFFFLFRVAWNHFWTGSSSMLIWLELTYIFLNRLEECTSCLGNKMKEFLELLILGMLTCLCFFSTFIMLLLKNHLVKFVCISMYKFSHIDYNFCKFYNAKSVLWYNFTTFSFCWYTDIIK